MKVLWKRSSMVKGFLEVELFSTSEWIILRSCLEGSEAFCRMYENWSVASSGHLWLSSMSLNL